MPLIAIALALIAAALHVLFFYFESVVFTQPATWQRFRIASQQDADTIAPMALNQGFYNLFLAGGVLLGVILLAINWTEAGRAIVLFACLSMALAGAVLVTSNRKLFRAAALQAVPPLLAILATLVLR